MEANNHYTEVDPLWLSEQLGICLCLSVIPLRGKYARPSLNCPVHKTLAARWDSIRTQEQFNAALVADYRPEWSENRKRVGQADPWANDPVYKAKSK